MKKKTCGECKHLVCLFKDKTFGCCGINVFRNFTDSVCSRFEPHPVCNEGVFLFCDEVEEAKPFIDKELKKRTKPTNGDKIIAGGKRALLNFAKQGNCGHCAFYRKEDDTCQRPEDKFCNAGLEIWLDQEAKDE